MKIIKFFRYLIEAFIIVIFFFIFKILGIKISSYISGKIFTFIGPFFRSKKTIMNNFNIAFLKFQMKKLRSIQKICGIIMGNFS